VWLKRTPKSCGKVQGVKENVDDVMQLIAAIAGQRKALADRIPPHTAKDAACHVSIISSLHARDLLQALHRDGERDDDLAAHYALAKLL